MPTPTTARGFKLACPRCNTEDATLRIDLADVATVTCAECEEDFTVLEARDSAAAALAGWEALLRWTEAAPIRE